MSLALRPQIHLGTITSFGKVCSERLQPSNEDFSPLKAALKVRGFKPINSGKLTVFKELVKGLAV